jgi:membrane associated rhomboid family serine protease
MFLPLKDINPSRAFPFVNYLLIAANVLGYVVESLAIRQSGAAAILAGYGVVPTRLLADPPGEALTLLSSMFMHGDLTHLLGNMLLLHIFGDNVEDSLGHGRYLCFYLLGGLGAVLGHVATGIDSPRALVGASGAIAAVLGAYMVLYPRAPIFGLLVIFPLMLPAWAVMGQWFLINLLAGVQSLGLPSMGGVAFFAHVGGFVTGLLGVRLFVGERAHRQSLQWSGWRPPPRRAGSRSRYEAWRGD